MKRAYFSLLLFITAVSITALSSCRFGCVHGSGNKITETRKITDFKKIDISGGFVVNLKQDSLQTLTIDADDNLLKYIRTSVEGDKLRIYSKKNFCTSGQIVVNLSIRNLEQVKGSGAIELNSNGKLNTKDLSLKFSGASKVTLDLNAANVNTEGSGATEINLKGQASTHNVSLTGSGKINALDFVVGSYDIQTTGASHCQINVLNNLAVHSTGASDIQYRGNPTNIDNNKTGASTITKIE